MSDAPRSAILEVNGHPVRVWRKGRSADGQRPLGFLPGIGGLPRWTPFLDLLAREREVVAPSLPGFPGATGHDELDTLFDCCWRRATSCTRPDSMADR